MKIHFPKLYRDDRRGEPCQVTVPLGRGAAPAGARMRILDGGKEIPTQSRVLARYPDGSAKYLMLRFRADLPGNRKKDLDAEWTEDPPEAIAGIRTDRAGALLRVDGGEGGLRFALRENGPHLMDELWDGRTRYGAEQFVGPRLKDGGGRVFLPTYESWRITEEGPLVTVIRGAGTLRPEGGEGRIEEELPRFETKITVFAGKPWIDVAFRLINDTGEALRAESFLFALLADGAAFSDRPPQMHIREKGDSVGEGSTAAGAVLQERDLYETTGTKLLPKIEKRFPKGVLRCCAGRSNYKTNFLITGGSPAEKTVETASLMAEANEHYIESFYGTFFADRTEGESGVCATVFQAQQNYPKAIRSDRDGICVMLIPEGSEKVVFESGMSREQRFQLHFHPAEEPLAEIDNRSLIYQMPDRPWLDPEIWRAAGLGPDIFLPPEKMIPEVEIALINRCDGHSRCLGMLNFGDAPDMNYTQQGRGKGSLVWTNNEYDFPHACALAYMRTGERRFMDYMIASATHWMDVDVCHRRGDPVHYGGQWEHCRRHVLDSTMVPSHEWVEGLLDLYHLTGEDRALETAIGIGENVLRLLEGPTFQTSGESNARETGWALRTLTALYLETGDPRWTEKAEWIVGHFREWMDTYGGWVAPYTDNTLIHVPFMIAVAMGSLYRYYEVFPTEELRDMLLKAADDLTESCLTPWGLFYYKELPSLNRIGNNTLILEALTIAWKLSGDERYLRMGLPTFRRDLAAESHPAGRKTVMEGTVVMENEPPKHFAQSFIPVAVYYKAAAEAGLL